jgi:hypothetical protein
MALYRQELLEHVLGINVYVPDWYLGLYVSGTNPLTVLADAEIAEMRTLIDGLFSWNGTNLANSRQVVTGLSATTCDAGGWFLVNGTSADILWTEAFVIGESVVFLVGSIVLDFELP